jgi:hypothetical protein
VAVDGDGVSVDHSGDLEVIREPRPPLTTAFDPGFGST